MSAASEACEGTGAPHGERRGVAIATWNIHRCIGGDGREDRARTAAVIGELDACVVALQEVDGGAQGLSGQLAELAERTGMTAVAGPTLRNERGDYGNALLSRHPILGSRRIDLSVPGREPRGALEATVDLAGRRLRVIATHLGLARRERALQLARLLPLLAEPAGSSEAAESSEFTDSSGPVGRRPDALALLGDMNEWLPRRGVIGHLDRRFGASPARASFPARRPLLALDRIWLEPHTALRSCEVHRSRLARTASDHLPLRAQLAWEGAAASPGSGS